MRRGICDRPKEVDGSCHNGSVAARRSPRTRRYCPMYAVLLAGLLTVPATAQSTPETHQADHWPMWRGPAMNGFAPHADPPVTWGESKNIRWKIPVAGDGSSTPVCWNHKLFVLSAEATDRPAEQPAAADPRALTRPPDVYYRFHVWCIDRHSGQTIWHDIACETVPHEGIHPTHSYAAASPITDGQRLYVSFGSRGIYAYDLDGNRLWERQLGRMNTRRGWGEGTSPALAGDLLLVNWDHEDASKLYALDIENGAIRWQIKRDEVTSWATPAVVEYDGTTQVIVPGTNRIRSYRVTDGSEIWTCGGQTVNCIPSPIIHKDTVICLSGYRGAAAAAIPLASTGDVTDSSSLRWQHDRGTPYVPSAAVDGRKLFFTSTNTPILTCLDIETGEILLDRKRLSQLGDMYASPLVAAGRLYLVDRQGQSLVLRFTDGDVEVLAANVLDDAIDASPLAIGEQLYLRGRKHLYCLQAPSTSSP